MGFLSKAAYIIWALLFEQEVLCYVPRVKDTDQTSAKKHYLLRRSKLFKGDFKAKLRYFRQQLALNSSQEETRLKFLIRRDHLLEDAFRLVMNANVGDLRRGRLTVLWEGEEGLDQGGLAKEFFCILSRELFDRKYGFFEFVASEGIGAIHVSPLAVSFPDSSTWFRFSGRVLGLALLHNHLLDVRLAPSLCKMLLRAPICLDDIKAEDAELHRSLCWLRDNNIGAGHNLSLTFAVSEQLLGRVVEHELLPGGSDISVTEHNKWEFLRLMLRWRMRLDGLSSQSLKALIYGFYEIVDWDHINLFEAHELSLLLSGGQHLLSVSDWRRHTVYSGGYCDQHPVIIWFWETVENFTRDEQLRLLQFVTGSNSLPYGGFAALSQRFNIRQYGKPNDLPRAHTCINRLYLPLYAEPKILHDKLLYALNEANECFGLA